MQQVKSVDKECVRQVDSNSSDGRTDTEEVVATICQICEKGKSREMVWGKCDHE